MQNKLRVLVTRVEYPQSVPWIWGSLFVKARALYLHIPFCKAKCLYCDFDSRALGGCELDAAMDRYCSALTSQIDTYGAAGELDEVETVYIGGGTPSLLGARLVSLVERVRGYCDPVEFTCEANPESFTLELAQALREAGVTRISLGVQTLDAGELKAIGRIHSAEQAMLAIAQAKAVGFSTSCDVMCGLPGQTLESFGRTLDTLMTLRLDHISVYPLQLEEGTPLARLEEQGRIAVPDEDFQAACMDLAAKKLTGAGFERYEVASYAQPGQRCRHNIAYWTGKPYLGLGRSAAGMFDLPAASEMLNLTSRPLRTSGTNPVDASGVIADFGETGPTPVDGSCPSSIPHEGRMRYRQLDDEGVQFDTEHLTLREAMAEDLMLACRMTDGIGIDLLKRAASCIPEADLRTACESAISSGLAMWDVDALGKGALKPTHLGWLDGNELFGLFWGLAM